MRFESVFRIAWHLIEDFADWVDELHVALVTRAHLMSSGIVPCH
jgi:hypothetical protein